MKNQRMEVYFEADEKWIEEYLNDLDDVSVAHGGERFSTIDRQIFRSLMIECAAHHHALALEKVNYRIELQYAAIKALEAPLDLGQPSVSPVSYQRNGIDGRGKVLYFPEAEPIPLREPAKGGK